MQHPNKSSASFSKLILQLFGKLIKSDDGDNYLGYNNKGVALPTAYLGPGHLFMQTLTQMVSI